MLLLWPYLSTIRSRGLGGFPSNQTRYSPHEGENLPKQKVLAQPGLSTQEASRLGLLLPNIIERHLEIREALESLTTE